MSAALQDLLARLEVAEGPDRELDCYVEAFVSRYTPDGQFHIVGPPTYDPRRFFYNPLPSVDWIGYDLLNVSPAYTGSLDASLALVERVLPGWAWMAGCAPGGGYFCTLQEAVDDEMALGGESDSYAKTPVLALLCALVKALIAQSVEVRS